MHIRVVWHSFRSFLGDAHAAEQTTLLLSIPHEKTEMEQSKTKQSMHAVDARFRWKTRNPLVSDA